MPSTKIMVFDREQQDSIMDGVWRDYEGGIKSKIRPLTPQHSRQMRKEAQKSGRFDQDVFDRLFWDHLIAEWNVPEAIKRDGVIVGSKPMPCTAENKVTVIRAWQGYRNWVTTIADSLGEEVAQVEQKQLGNSGGLPAGKQTGPGVETSSLPAPAAK